MTRHEQPLAHAKLGDIESGVYENNPKSISIDSRSPLGILLFIISFFAMDALVGAITGLYMPMWVIIGGIVGWLWWNGGREDEEGRQ